PQTEKPGLIGRASRKGRLTYAAATTGGDDDDDGDEPRHWQAKPNPPGQRTRQPQTECDQSSLKNLPKPALNGWSRCPAYFQNTVLAGKVFLTALPIFPTPQPH